KEKFIRQTIHQPILDVEKWQSELADFGLPFQKDEAILPIIGLLDDYSSAKHRFMSDDVLRFAVDNVIEEAIRSEGRSAIHLNYSQQESVLLYKFPAGLKVNGYDEAKLLVGSIQQAMKQSLKLSMSFMLGD